MIDHPDPVAAAPGALPALVGDRLPRLARAIACLATLDVEEDDAVNLADEWDPLESTCRHASLSIL